MNNPKPIVESFSLLGVHGYKDITIDFLGAATIVAAENGTGKTTVLSALNAFLTRRFHRLASLNFKSLKCKLSGMEPVILERASLVGVSADALASSVRSISRQSDMPEEEILDFIQNEFDPNARPESYRTHAFVFSLYQAMPGDWEDTMRELNDLHAHQSNSLSSEARSMSALLRDRLGHFDVVYLPTFRRIERPLLRAQRPRPGLATRRQRNEYTYQGVTFGLGDIQARLTEISTQIERMSNYGYRDQSAQILDELLQGRGAKINTAQDHLPDIDSLSLFLGRLGRNDRNLKEVFKNINALYETGEINNADYDVLRFFLARLNIVIGETKSLEQKVEEFVRVCNSYLTMSSDEKKLEFDPVTLKVGVKNTWADCEVDLDALSSGEKQIVSLMAKLYLYDKDKILLIDEPELSLSIEWQKKVLPDVMKSGSVQQLLAITHSPFIFDNELDGFAATMKVTRTGTHE